MCLTFSPEPQCIRPGKEGVGKCVLNEWRFLEGLMDPIPVSGNGGQKFAVEGVFGNSSSPLSSPSPSPVTTNSSYCYHWKLIFSSSVPLALNLVYGSGKQVPQPSKTTSLHYIYY